MSAGETPSTSAMLSKPAAESSGGSSALTSTSSASRSRMALAYSARFRRCSAGAPGSRRRAAARSSAASSAAVNVCARRGRRLRRAVRRHHAGAQLAHDLLPRLGVAVDVRRVRARRAPGRRPSRARCDRSTQYCLRKRRIGRCSRAAGARCAERPPADAPATADAGARRRRSAAHGRSSGHRSLDQPLRAAPSSTAWRPASWWRGTRPPPRRSGVRPSLSATSSRAPRLRQQLDDVVRAAVGRAVHRRQPHLVHRVDVAAQLEAQLHGLEPARRRLAVGLADRPSSRRPPPSARSCR